MWDLTPSPLEGRDLVSQLHAANPHLPVILMTGAHTAEIAIDVMKLGAFDFIRKETLPFNSRAAMGAPRRRASPSSMRRLPSMVGLCSVPPTVAWTRYLPAA